MPEARCFLRGEPDRAWCSCFLPGFESARVEDSGFPCLRPYASAFYVISLCARSRSRTESARARFLLYLLFHVARKLLDLIGLADHVDGKRVLGGFVDFGLQSECHGQKL